MSGGKFGFANQSWTARFAAWDIGNAQDAGRTKFSKALQRKKAAPTPEAYLSAPVADVIDGTRLVA